MTDKTSPYKPTDCDICAMDDIWPDKIKSCGCPNADYYPITAIRYCRVQMFFLIENLDLLEDNLYPDVHVQSGYTDIDPSIRIEPSGGSLTAALIYADVSSRLKRCGEDGKTLVHEIQVLHADYYGDLSWAAKNAINYCEGFRQRTMSYRKWLKQQERRRRERKNDAKKASLKLT